MWESSTPDLWRTRKLGIHIDEYAVYQDFACQVGTLSCLSVLYKAPRQFRPQVEMNSHVWFT